MKGLTHYPHCTDISLNIDLKQLQPEICVCVSGGFVLNIPSLHK